MTREIRVDADWIPLDGAQRVGWLAIDPQAVRLDMISAAKKNEPVA